MEANTEAYHVKLIHATTVGPSLDDRRNVNTFYATVRDEWLHRVQCPRKDAITDPSDFPRILKPWVKLHLVLRYLPELGITFRRQYPATTAVLANQHHHQVCGLDHVQGLGRRPILEGLKNIWTRPEDAELSQVLMEDTSFGSWIQESMGSWGFKGVPLSYQEACICHWNQWTDRLIGIENIPEEIRLAQVMNR